MFQEKIIRGLRTGWVEQGPRTGNSPIYIFLHGFPDTPHIWEPLMSKFGAQSLLVAPYLRGVGPSEKGPSSRFGPSAMSQDCLEILYELDRTRKRKVIIVCHDIGADAGWELGRMLKGDLKALVMMNGFSSDHFAKRLMQPSQALKSWYVGFFQIPIPPRALVSGAAFKFLKSRLQAANHPLGEAEWRQALDLIECYRSSMRFGLKSFFTKVSPIEAPLYVLWGRRDKILNIPKVSDFDKRCPVAHMKVFDAGHWLQYEIPEVIHAELLKIENAV